MVNWTGCAVKNSAPRTPRFQRASADWPLRDEIHAARIVANFPSLPLTRRRADDRNRQHWN